MGLIVIQFLPDHDQQTLSRSSAGEMTKFEFVVAPTSGAVANPDSRQGVTLGDDAREY